MELSLKIPLKNEAVKNYLSYHVGEGEKLRLKGDKFHCLILALLSKSNEPDNITLNYPESITLKLQYKNARQWYGFELKNKHARVLSSLLEKLMREEFITKCVIQSKTNPGRFFGLKKVITDFQDKYDLYCLSYDSFRKLWERSDEFQEWKLKEKVGSDAYITHHPGYPGEAKKI